MGFSEVIKKALETNGITPSELARKTGYSAQYIGDVLKGHRRWNETTLTKACDVLGLEIVIVQKPNADKVS